jgi:surface protein
MIGFNSKNILPKHVNYIFGRMVSLVFMCLVFLFSFSFSTMASEYTMCTGKEFNRRVKAFLNGIDVGDSVDNTITAFTRGYNPPDDPAYYVDISEDLDGSIIAYLSENDVNNVNKKKKQATDYNYTLYWYSDHVANMNSNAAFMFDKFVRIRNIDLSGFAYLKGLTDTRYMFLECRNLKSLTFKKSKEGKPFAPSEMQGMFFSCQSLTNVDLTLFDTKMVDNMDEMFYRCYNLRNIYVDKSRWNIENVRTFNRMFSKCYCLVSNDGKKAVDVAEDEYEKYAVPGDDSKEGFIKDVNYTYDDYGEYTGYVPIDGAHYLMEEPETTQPYAEEPEYDSETGNGAGSGIIPYVGDKSTGYGGVKEQLPAPSIINPTGESEESGRKIETTEKEAVMVPTVVSDAQGSGTAESKPLNIETTARVVETASPNVESATSAETAETVTESSAEIIETSIADSNVETAGKRVIELDEYLKEQGQEGNNGQGDVLGTVFENYKFLILALAISAIVILLLVGMVAYLTKSNRENKDDNSHKI